MSDYQECEPFVAYENVRQGTIIKFNDRSCNNENLCYENFQEEYGIIVTADCDIAQKKHGIFLSYCPIMKMSEYFQYFIIPNACLKKLNDKISGMKRTLKDCLRENTLDDATYDHILRYSDDMLQKMIKNRQLIEDIKKIRPVINNESFSVSDYKLLGGKDFAGRDKLPGDKFQINDLPKPFQNSGGYVVDLRRIKEIKRSDISTSFLPNEKICFAVAKLLPPYKYKLTQQLGTMFSDIGLPDPYLDDCKLNFNIEAEECLK